MLCARDGQAKRVIALEQSSCIEYARRIVTDNRYSTVITLIQSSVRKMTLILNKLHITSIYFSVILNTCITTLFTRSYLNIFVFKGPRLETVTTQT